MHFGGRHRVCGLRRLKESASVLEFGLNISRCHEAKVANADKAFGEHMEEEATDKLEGRQVDASVRSGLLIVPGPEGNRLAIKGEDPLVGDGRPVGVMAQVGEDMSGSTEGRFGVDNPFGSLKFSDPPFKDRWVSPVSDVA